MLFSPLPDFSSDFVDCFAAGDAFCFPSAGEEVALFSFFFEGVDGSLAADDFFDPPPGEEEARFSFLADVVDCFAAAAFGGSSCSRGLSAFSRSFVSISGVDSSSPCEDAGVDGGYSE